MFQPPPPSYSAPGPEVVAADARQKWQGSRRGRLYWLITALIVVGIIVLVIFVLNALPN